MAALRCKASAAARPACPGRRHVVVRARGPIVTKRGVAFKGQGLPEPEQPEEPELGAAGAAAIAGGLVSNPIVLWSAFTLYKTGEGLPPGPNGALGAAEGVSYLAVLGLVAWSLYTKVSTGKGLPPGPSGLLGAVEGLSYLSILAGGWAVSWVG
ncbi:hypothetical protein QJQ45_005541 [Haematococcus lacustris]|nr:hypothetical protein QJQ45_005541 [Haematococcus lacustris]